MLKQNVLITFLFQSIKKLRGMPKVFAHIQCECMRFRYVPHGHMHSICACVLCGDNDAFGFIGVLKPATADYSVSCTGKKNGDVDRNFDTLDLPKRSESAKGNAQTTCICDKKDQQSLPFCFFVVGETGMTVSWTELLITLLGGGIEQNRPSPN